MSRLPAACLATMAVLLPAGALALAAWPQSPAYGPVVSHGPRDRRVVALTFDDGPNAPATREILAILQERGARATFFVTGASAAADPETVRALVMAGQVVGNHSYSHRKRHAIFDYAYEEALRAQQAVFAAAGVCPALFRAPNGFHTPWQLNRIDADGLTAVAWDVQTYDWQERLPARIVQRVLDQVEPGSIILLHDGADLAQGAGRGPTVAALPLIIDALRAQGYDFITVDELLGTLPYLERCA